MTRFASFTKSLVAGLTTHNSRLKPKKSSWGLKRVTYWFDIQPSQSFVGICKHSNQQRPGGKAVGRHETIPGTQNKPQVGHRCVIPEPATLLTRVTLGESSSIRVTTTPASVHRLGIMGLFQWDRLQRYILRPMLAQPTLHQNN